MALIEYVQISIYMNLIYEDRYQLILSGLWATLLLTVCLLYTSPSPRD